MISRIVTPTGIAIFLALPAAASAAPAIATFINEADADGLLAGGTLFIYDGDGCAAEMAMECSIATLSCGEGQGLAISVDSMETKAMVSWMEGEDFMTVKLVGITGEGTPYFNGIGRSDLDGTWNASFNLSYSSDPGLVIDGDAITIESFNGKVSVDLNDKNRKLLEEFVQSCAIE